MSTDAQERARAAARSLHFGPLCKCNKRWKAERPESCAVCCGKSHAVHARAEVERVAVMAADFIEHGDHNCENAKARILHALAAEYKEDSDA